MVAVGREVLPGIPNRPVGLFDDLGVQDVSDMKGDDHSNAFGVSVSR